MTIEMTGAELRAHMRAVFSARHSNSEKTQLRSYSVDSARENAVTEPASRNCIFPNKNNDVTALLPISSNKDSQSEKLCQPTMAYRATLVGPDGTGCKVEIVELPQAQRYRKAFGVLQLRPPALVPEDRWRQCVKDGSKFLARWGEQAEALGWTPADLFGLQTPRAKAHATYNRLSRYDCTGLVWLLQGRAVVALTADTATIRNPATGSVTTYRRFNKPALGPLGDSLDDLK
jgi:hypothetical protein